MSSGKRQFLNVTSEGGILPVDLLGRIYAQDATLPGLNPVAYHLDSTERLTDAIARAWGPLRARWMSFKAEREKFSDSERGTSETRERWLLPLFSELGYGRLITAKAEEIQGKSYPISHAWNSSPIHLVSCTVRLDEKRAGVAGAARNSPHGLVQEYLNRSPGKLWGFVSNGLLLRVVRDNVSLTRQAYVEFDLESIFDTESFADFALLWLICHESRVEGARPETSILEQWSELARSEGTRALEQLRAGVEKGIEALGSGFLACPANTALRDALKSGQLSKGDYYRELLRLIYRFIFLFAAEDRGLLLSPTVPEKAKLRYLNFYSSARLRTLCTEIRGGHQVDLYRSLKIVFAALGSESGVPELGLPALGSFLWSSEALPSLGSCDLPNSNLLDALRALTTVTDGKVRRQVDYKNLGSEELGSIYESLLELHPEIHAEAAVFKLDTAMGNERKTTGSYYTPTSLINCLLDSALEPVVEAALKQDKTEKAILSLKVCDPACGSGHFLIAAAHRLAKHLARIRTGESEPPPEATRKALRDVVGHCIYGVDINPMAVELCKVGLWLDALEPGKPLSFLEHRIQCGNSLLGATPALLEKGIPDEAFEPIEGDDKKICSLHKKRNKKERESTNQVTMFGGFEAWDRLGNIGSFINTLDSIDDSSIDGIRKKQRLYEEQVRGSNYLFSRFWADAWCAAFVWNKSDIKAEALTEEVFRRIERNPHTVSKFVQDEVKRLAQDYKFFHWHLAFPDVFRIPKRGEKPANEQMGWSGGFEVLLGNPPWERIKIQEKEWFAVRSPTIAAAPNAAARTKLINDLEKSDPALLRAFESELRRAEGESHFIRSSQRYPLCGRGDVNTYSIFAETACGLIESIRGAAGIIVPSGVATDDTTKFYFQKIVEAGRIRSLYDFENREEIFTGVHRSFKFTLLTLGAPQRDFAGKFAFFLQHPRNLASPDRVFPLSAKDIALVNPNTRTCPIFSNSRDAKITKSIYERVPVLIREGEQEENPWGISFRAMFHMSNDSNLFKTRAELETKGLRLEGNVFEGKSERYLPLYEAKMIHQFDHRWATYDGTESRDVTLVEKQNPDFEPLPRYWVIDSEVEKAIPKEWPHPWLLGWRDICRSTDERTVIASLVPRVAVNHKFPLIYSRATQNQLLCLFGNLCSIILDYVARQKLGGTSLTYFVLKQLPVLGPSIFELRLADSKLTSFIGSRVAELALLNYPPFSQQAPATSMRWDDNSRSLMRAELDAAFFHLYGISRGDTEYILDQFPVLRKNEEKEHGEFRTKRLVLEAYEKLASLSPKMSAANA